MTLPGFTPCPEECQDGWQDCGTGLYEHRCPSCGGAGQTPDRNTVCPSCNHEWRHHDPDDGKCDAYPGGYHCHPHEVVAAFARAALLAYARKAKEQT